jgi:hypothetical protein
LVPATGFCGIRMIFYISALPLVKSNHIHIFLRLLNTRVILVLLALLLAGNTVASAQGRAYKLKSVFLLNFTQFIEWPQAAFASARSPFVIGIVGKDPFGSYLNETVRNETVHGHPIIVQRYSSLRDVRSCHLLFVCNNIREFNGLPARSLLTVGEAPDFNRAGGMIQFYSEKDRVRFQVRPSLIRAAHLNISSKLLRLAKIAE